MPRMQARRCQGCAAPLPDGAAGEPVRCTFCGLLHDAATTGPRVQVHQVHQVQGARRVHVPGWVLGLIALAVLGGIIAPVVFGFFLAWRGADAAFDTARSVVSTPVAPTRPAARTTAQLKDLPGGYHALQVAPPTGGYGAVDAIVALPWALAIAQAWQEDARLERIDISRLRPDGSVNVQDDGEAALTYRFVSGVAAKALREQARLRASAEAVVGLWVRVKDGAPQVYADVSRAGSLDDDDPPPHPDAEPLMRLLGRPPVQALCGDLAFLNGYLIHSAGEGWVWYFSSLASESKPRVRARDGAVWPYRGRGR